MSLLLFLLSIAGWGWRKVKIFQKGWGMCLALLPWPRVSWWTCARRRHKPSGGTADH